MGINFRRLGLSTSGAALAKHSCEEKKRRFLSFSDKIQKKGKKSEIVVGKKPMKGNKCPKMQIRTLRNARKKSGKLE